jgi:hypothetical protein
VAYGAVVNVLSDGDTYGVTWTPSLPSLAAPLPLSPAPKRPGCQIYQARGALPNRPSQLALAHPRHDECAAPQSPLLPAGTRPYLPVTVRPQ